jgi:hypothetical protein
MPLGSCVSERESRDLLAKSPKITNHSIRFGSDADSVQVALVIAQVQGVSLVENAEFLIITQVGCPLCGPWSPPPVMLVVEEVTVTIPLGRHGMLMTRFTTHRHQGIPQSTSETHWPGHYLIINGKADCKRARTNPLAEMGISTRKAKFLSPLEPI